MANQLKLGTCYCVSHRLRVVWDMSPSQNYARGVVVHVDLPNTKRAHSTQHTAIGHWPTVFRLSGPIIWSAVILASGSSVTVMIYNRFYG